ncbi:acylphosphatase [Primorskyibacter flagellatus]|uniref:Acylphosphatase n=1 Tax=Primorskyibacter flagellatus TaxID=1387277 RepID=A0A1W2EFT6_9RHOB|nr:acylphosphatase [Primorskyibacter flagellatus]SMD08563.1 acylphosphatase [Primorskyibacter flagellatus]
MTRKIARKARVMGQVQGVAFRTWTQAEARKRDLHGWVRNNDDGSVSAMFIGPEDAVEEMLDRLRDGPGAAAVRDIEVEKLPASPDISGFEITG